MGTYLNGAKLGPHGIYLMGTKHNAFLNGMIIFAQGDEDMKPLNYSAAVAITSTYSSSPQTAPSDGVIIIFTTDSSHNVYIASPGSSTYFTIGGYSGFSFCLPCKAGTRVYKNATAAKASFIPYLS